MSSASGATLEGQVRDAAAPMVGERGPIECVSIGTNPRATAGELGSRSKVGSVEEKCGSCKPEWRSLPATCHAPNDSKLANPPAVLPLKRGAVGGWPAAKYVLLTKVKFDRLGGKVAPTIVEVEEGGEKMMFLANVNDEHLPWSQPGLQQQSALSGLASGCRHVASR